MRFPKKPSLIFVNSMSDIQWWSPEWMDSVLIKIAEYPQHKFIFLTKEPITYSMHNFPDNCWLGATSDNGEIREYMQEPHKQYKNLRILNFEPMLKRPDLKKLMKIIHTVGWIIMGAQTNPTVLPEKEWLRRIVNIANKNKVPIFMKNSLKPIWPELIQEFPNENSDI